MHYARLISNIIDFEQQQYRYNGTVLKKFEAAYIKRIKMFLGMIVDVV